MRQIICDDKGCRVKPSHQNLIGGGGVNTLSESSGGLAPVAPSKLIPLIKIEKKKDLSEGGSIVQGQKRKRSCVKNGYKRRIR